MHGGRRLPGRLPPGHRVHAAATAGTATLRDLPRPGGVHPPLQPGCRKPRHRSHDHPRAGPRNAQEWRRHRRARGYTGYDASQTGGRGEAGICPMDDVQGLSSPPWRRSLRSHQVHLSVRVGTRPLRPHGKGREGGNEHQEGCSQPAVAPEVAGICPCSCVHLLGRPSRCRAPYPSRSGPGRRSRQSRTCAPCPSPTRRPRRRCPG